MSGQFIDYSAPSLQGGLQRRPEELPHGLIRPPEKVLDMIAKERTKHPAEAFARQEEELLNEWILQHYFDYLGHEVLYRVTSEGPEVLAVGFEEILAYRKAVPSAGQSGLKTWLPY